MKFKNYIEVQSGIKDSADSPGTLDQVLTSTATGVAWVDPSTISAEAATLVVIECKNTSGATITKGTPVYQTGTVGATDVIEIAPADALISAGSQPAIGLLQTTLNDNGFGKVVITGEFLNFTTDPIDGVTPTTGQKVFLKSGGGLTLTKPTGAENGIQNLGLIGKVSGGSAGSITVSSIMRTNDVPNLPTGKIWVGDGNTIVSDTVFLDEPNGRMGIGTISPTNKLNVNGDIGYIGVIGQGSIYGNTGNSSFSTMQLYDPSTGYTTLNNQSYGYYFNTSGGTKVTILNGGNVGIGTTSPTKTLNVKFNSSSVDPETGEGLGGGSAGTGVLLTNSNTTVGTFANLDFRANNVDARIAVTHNATNNGDFHFILDNTAAAPVTRLIIEGETGNVGIGTTSPGGKLHIHQTVNGTNNSIITEDDARKIFIGRDSIKATNLSDNPAELYIQQHGGNATFGNDVSLGGNLTLTTNARYLRAEDSAGTTTRLLGINGSNTTYIGPIDAYAGGSILYGTAAGVTFQRFFTGASERLRIGSNGNVAIGTTATSYRLQVEQDNDGNLLSRFHNTAANGQGLLIRAGGVSSANRILQLASENDTKVMTVNSNGNVGIGTTSPSVKLHVGGLNADSSGLLLESPVSDVNVNFNFIIGDTSLGLHSKNLVIKGSSGSSDIAFSPSSSFPGLMVLDGSTGNVGIGTTIPSQLLHLSDDDGHTQKIQFGLDSIDNHIGVVAYDTLQLSVDENNANGNSAMTFRLDGQEAMRVSTQRNVGIGTTSPSEKLDVVGNIKLNGVLYIGSRGIYQQENTDVSGLELVANASINLYRAAFFDYVIQKQGNVRAGTVFACNDGGSVEYTETSTNDIGDTSDVVLSVDISGTNMRLLADAATSGWSVKSLIRAI